MLYKNLRFRKLKALSIYTSPTQRSAWRWPYNLAETCSWIYNM